MPKLSDFQPQKINANKHTQRGRGLLQNSMQRDGYSAPMVAAKDGEVFIGSHRLEVAGEVFSPDAEPIIVESDGSRPVIIKRVDIETADDPKAKRLGLADNRIAQLSLDWDVGILQSFELPDLDLVGFNQNELIGLCVIEQPQTDAEPQFDRATELLEKWQVKTGDLWQIGEHRLLCGDSTKRADVERLMDGEKAMVFTDAPYGVEIISTHKAKDSIGYGGQLGFGGADGIVPVNAYAPIVGDETTQTAEAFYKLCSEIGIEDFILWGGNYFTAFLPPSPCWLVWDKREEIPSNNFADCEIMWTSFDKPSRIYRHLWSGLLRKGNRKDELVRRIHPTQKPVGLYKKIMQDFPADCYYDGFVGSGTAMVACENLGRRCRAIEISPAYCAVTLERMSQAFPALPITRIE